MSQNKLHLTHCHGSENYFILVDGLTYNLDFEENDYAIFTKKLVKELKNLHIDGVLFLLPSEKADARMRIFNKDGSEPEMCGNGFRCISRKVYEITGKEEFKIETMKKVLSGKKEEELFPDIESYSVLIPEVKFAYKNKIYENEIIPEINPDLKFCSVDMGNPHIITEMEKFNEILLIYLGEQINNTRCKIFPEGNNISFYKKIGQVELFVMTYERGVGLTNSCGTAIAATTIIAAKNKRIPFNKWISIYNKGGMVKCFASNKNNQYQVKLLGNATFIKEYILDYDTKNQTFKNIISNKSHPMEVLSYMDFKQATATHKYE